LCSRQSATIAAESAAASAAAAAVHAKGFSVKMVAHPTGSEAARASGSGGGGGGGGGGGAVGATSAQAASNPVAVGFNPVGRIVEKAPPTTQAPAPQVSDSSMCTGG
jgi:hypothetical protein